MFGLTLKLTHCLFLAPATAPRDVTSVAVELLPSWVSLSWQPPRQTNGQITGDLTINFAGTRTIDLIVIYIVRIVMHLEFFTVLALQ